MERRPSVSIGRNMIQYDPNGMVEMNIDLTDNKKQTAVDSTIKLTRII